MLGCTTCRANLGVVGLLNLLLVDADLFLVLGPQVAQGLGQFALKVLLAPAVDLHHAGLVATLGLAQLLHKGVKQVRKRIVDKSLKSSRVAEDAIRKINIGLLIMRQQHLLIRRPVKILVTTEWLVH